MRLTVFEVFHIDEAQNDKKHHNRNRCNKYRAPPQIRDQCATYNRGECGAKRNGASTQCEIRSKLILRRHGQNRIHHKRDEHARTHRLNNSRDQEHDEIRRDEAQNRTGQSKATRGKEQRSQLNATIEERHAHNDNRRGDHESRYKPLRRN